MAENADKYPKLRFPGFTDAWERRKLSELADFSKGRGYSKGDLTESGTPIILYGRLYTKYETVISEVDTFVRAKENSVFSNGNEVIAPASGETAEDISRAAVVENAGIILGGDLNVLKPNPTINPIFLALAISNGEQQKELSRRAQGKSVVHIHNSDIQEATLVYPKLDEQKKIGSFFVAVDRLITLHQRECDKTVNIKKALLEKMFPKDGENKPEIRFPGFTDAWERREFEELVFRVSLQSDEYHLPRVEYEDIVSGQGQLNKDIFEKKSSKTGIRFEAQDILFGKLRPYLHNWLLPDFTGIAVGDWWVLRPNETSHKFIYALIQSAKYQYVSNLSIGTKMPRSDWSVVSKTQFVVPSDIVEQAKIGMFFVNLDRLITLHQRELKKLQNIKKALLDNMFA